MPPLRNLLVRIWPSKHLDYEPIANDNLPFRSHNQAYRRHAHRRHFTFRNFCLCLPAVLISILFLNGFPSFYTDIREYERRLPQHHVNYSESRGVRYLAFPDHLWGNGWNNILQEYMMYSYLAYITNRSFVFDDFTWSHIPLPYTIYDLAFRPTRIPLNAFISGPTAGGPISTFLNSSELPPRAVHQEFWDSVCPPEKRHVISSLDTPSNVWGVDRIKWWKHEIEKRADARCLAVDLRQRPVFDFSFFGSQELLDVWPSLYQTPILKQFRWSPLVSSAIERNFVSLSDPHHSDDDLLLPSRTPSTSTYPALVAVHIRHGDYKRHCPRLASHASPFHGFNTFKDLPDPLVQPPSGAPPEDVTELYRKRCFPTQDEIAARLHSFREEHDVFVSNDASFTSSTRNNSSTSTVHPQFSATGSNDSSQTPVHKLRRVFVLSNAWPLWLDGLKRKLVEDGWEDVVFGKDLILDKQQRGVDVAVDMGIAERAEVFVGNGFSSLSGNIVMLRTAKGMHAKTNRLL